MGLNEVGRVRKVCKVSILTEIANEYWAFCGKERSESMRRMDMGVSCYSSTTYLNPLYLIIGSGIYVSLHGLGQRSVESGGGVPIEHPVAMALL